MTLEQGRELLAKGWTTKTITILGKNYTIRTITTSDMLLIQMIREKIISKKLDMTLETFSSIDTLIKLSVALHSVDEETTGFFTPEETEQLTKQMLGLNEEEHSKATETVLNKFLTIVSKYIMNLPVQVADKLSEEFNKFIDEVKQAIQSGEIVKN